MGLNKANVFGVGGLPVTHVYYSDEGPVNEENVRAEQHFLFQTELKSQQPSGLLFVSFLADLAGHWQAAYSGIPPTEKLRFLQIHF